MYLIQLSSSRVLTEDFIPESDQCGRHLTIVGGLCKKKILEVPSKLGLAWKVYLKRTESLLEPSGRAKEIPKVNVWIKILE